MSTVYLNGKFVKPEEAKVSVFDTGFYYGDGIYEVVLLHEGRLVELEAHLTRLEYVLNEVKFNNVPTASEFKKIIHDLVLKNKQKNGMVFLQITRGFMQNRYAKPESIKTPTIVAYIVETSISFDVAKKAVNCQLVLDPRRYRRDIKMTSLMPMILAKMEAQQEGYDYVIFKDRQSKAVTEGGSSNIFIVTKDDVIITHPVDKKILNGCTRKRTIQFLKEKGYEVKEVAFKEDALFEAKEAFLTGAIKLYAPIKTVNGKKIGNGKFKIASLCSGLYKEFADSFPKII